MLVCCGEYYKLLVFKQHSLLRFGTLKKKKKSPKTSGIIVRILKVLDEILNNRILKDTLLNAINLSQRILLLLLEYGAGVWDLFLKGDIDWIEKVQCQVVRFIMGLQVHRPWQYHQAPSQA